MDNMENKTNILLSVIENKDTMLSINGYIKLPTYYNQCELFLDDMSNIKKLELKTTENKTIQKIFCCDFSVYQVKEFFVLIPQGEYSFNLIFENQIVNNVGFKFGRFAHLSNILKNDYFICANKIVFKSKSKLIVKNYSVVLALKKEILLLAELLINKKITEFLSRILYFVGNLFLRNNEIWLISDRKGKAGDNGEFLFRYLMSLPKEHLVTPSRKKIKPYFFLDSNSKDYKRICNIGPTLPFFSKKYRIALLFASKMISSMANEYLVVPLGLHNEYLKSLLTYDFIHIQHGVIKDNLVDELNKQKMNIKMFITSSRLEQESIVKNRLYGYDENAVRITGLARFDAYYNLETCKRNILLVAPTWREFLVNDYDMYGYAMYNDEFKKQTFFVFFNNLINDSRVLNKLRQNNLHGKLLLHPIIQKQTVDFEKNDIFSVPDDEEKEELFKQTKLLVTDYSSIAFDYAYMKIPIIYAQFDRKDFFTRHTYTKGYFDYETMGFGPVCYDYENCILMILKAIDEKCTMKDKYLRRVNNFFAYHDGKNCERIYNEILAI